MEAMRAPASCAACTASTRSAGGSVPTLWHAGTMTVSARASSSRPCSVSTRNQPPNEVFFGAQTVKSYQGCTHSGRERPNTSHGTATSKAGTSLVTARATDGMSVIVRTVSFRTLVRASDPRQGREHVTRSARRVRSDQRAGAIASGNRRTELRSASADAAEAMLLVTGNHLAATGYLHAGCVVTLADTVCGYGCLAALPSRAAGFTTIELTSNPLSSAAAGHQLRAVATPLHLGRTTQVWDAKVTASSPCAEPKLISVFRCTQLILSQAP